MMIFFQNEIHELLGRIHEKPQIIDEIIPVQSQHVIDPVETAAQIVIQIFFYNFVYLT